MATSSFAVGSVSVAIVWGTFFYPPPPQRVGERATAAPSAVEQPESVRREPVRLANHAMPKLTPANLSSLPPPLAMGGGQRLAIKP
jgi:hypothetical protein